MKSFRILHAKETLTKNEMKAFRKGDTIFGNDSYPETISTFDNQEDAENELKNYKCSYFQHGELTIIEEYALEIYEVDEDGEFLYGSDYTMAGEE